MFISIKNLSPKSLVAYALGTAVLCAIPACGKADASADANIFDRSTHALTTFASVQDIFGTYSTCINRTTPWRLHVSGTPQIRSETALSVVNADTACVLSVTELLVADDTPTTPIVTSYIASPAIGLTAAYQGTASTFATTGAPTVAVFYANAKLDSVAFTGTFQLDLLYSDDPKVADNADNTATFAQVQYNPVLGGNGVPSPNYAADPSGLMLAVDANQMVLTATGNLVLTADPTTPQLGELYVEVQDADILTSFTYADVDTLWTTLTTMPKVATAISSTIAASVFALTSQTLQKTRQIIIAHTESNVRSYQVFTITFKIASGS